MSLSLIDSGSGIPGNLVVYIDQATNLLPDGDAYVRVANSLQWSGTVCDKEYQNEANPKWKTKLRFGRHLNRKIVRGTT